MGWAISVVPVAMLMTGEADPSVRVLPLKM
jgi:hypothetical protein